MIRQAWLQQLVDLLYSAAGRPREPAPPRLYLYRPDDRFTVTVSKSAYTLTVTASPAGIALAQRQGIELPRSYRVAIGANPDGGDKQAVGDKRTPEGSYRLCQKLALSRPADPFGGHFLRLDTRQAGWEGIGIHGTNKPHSIGSKATAGCVRMYNHDVAELYRLLPLGTMVHIAP